MLSLTVVCWEESVSGGSLCYSIQLGTVCVCMWRRVYPWGLSFDVGVSVCAHLASMELGERSFFLLEFYPAFKTIRSRCVCSCMYSESTPPSHHTITKPPPPDSPPSLYPLSCLATSFKTSAVSVRERWSDLCLCLFCVCGPSAACLQLQVSVCVRGCLRKN